PMLARIPAGHFAAPSDVAAAVLFLVSPAAEMLNGVELPIDGGYAVS
ncbi:MAG: SDR family oxidoreductase, partial [Actinomycetota bacterium]|nr:SDR family oxidoreductase [Actinomycetota bacterium]